MPLEHLLAALEADAKAQAERLLADARADAERIAGESAARTGRRRRDYVEARAAERRAAAELALADARWRARKEVLAARERFLERVFQAARPMLDAAIDGAAYRAGLAAKVADALACVAGAPADIRCAPSLAREIRRSLNGRTAVTVAPDPRVGAGFVVGTTDGAIAVDQTLGAALDRLRPRLALGVLRDLEGAP